MPTPELHDRFQKLYVQLVEYALEPRFDERLEEAVVFFYHLDEGEEYQFVAEDELLFLTWFLLDDPDDEGQTLVDRFLAERRDALSPQDLMLIEAIRTTHLSLMSVVETQPPGTLTLRDLFLRETFMVREVAGSRDIARGSLLFSRIMALGDHRFLVGAGIFLDGAVMDDLTGFLVQRYQRESEAHPISFRDFLKQNGELINWWIRAFQQGKTLDAPDDDDGDEGPGDDGGAGPDFPNGPGRGATSRFGDPPP